MTNSQDFAYAVDTKATGSSISASLFTPCNYAPIFDLEHEVAQDKRTDPKGWSTAREMMSCYPTDQLKWLKKQKAAYRIEARHFHHPVKNDPTMIRYGFQLTVWLEDGSVASLFKLTFGGAA